MRLFACLDFIDLICFTCTLFAPAVRFIAMNENPLWSYADLGHTRGPVDATEIGNLIERGVIQPDTWILAEGSDDWILAKESPFRNDFPMSAPLTDGTESKAQFAVPEEAQTLLRENMADPSEDGTPSVIVVKDATPRFGRFLLWLGGLAMLFVLGLYLGDRHEGPASPARGIAESTPPGLALGQTTPRPRASSDSPSMDDGYLDRTTLNETFGEGVYLPRLGDDLEVIAARAGTKVNHRPDHNYVTVASSKAFFDNKSTYTAVGTGRQVEAVVIYAPEVIDEHEHDLSPIADKIRKGLAPVVFRQTTSTDLIALWVSADQQLLVCVRKFPAKEVSGNTLHGSSNVIYGYAAGANIITDKQYVVRAPHS